MRIEYNSQWIGRIFPRLTLIPPSHRGVLFGPRGGAVEKPAGLVFWWPLVQRLEQVLTAIRSLDVAANGMKHAPLGGLVPAVAICGTVAVWHVADPVRAAVRASDLRRLVDNSAQAALAAEWQGLETATEAVARAEKSLRSELFNLAGIELLSLRRSHTGLALATLRLTDWTNSDA